VQGVGMLMDDTRRDPPPATMFPGEPGSLAHVGRRRFIADEIAYRERLHPKADKAELAYREQLDRA
jgi:hypothetical protein